MPESPSYDVFVSYAEADNAWVEGYLLEALEQAEVRCLYESSFTLGTPRILEFERAIRQSQYILLVISEAYLADDLTRFTDILAQSYGEQVGTWPVIPLTLQEGLHLPPRLKMLEGLKASNAEQWEAAIERLCHQLKHPLPPPSLKPACPYPGMIPFSENDEHRFFGRTEEIEELLGRLRLHPFLTVIGPSGSGKSSLVFAGLIPKLKQSGLFGMGQWCIRSLRPGTSPLVNLQAVLGNITAPEVGIQQLLSTQPETRRLLLVVDQFEEVFAQAGAETASFQQALLKLMEIPNVYVILTVRADFYPDLMGSLIWEKIRSYRFEVLPLNEKGLKQAIVRPAESVEVYVDSALVERLLVDAKGEPGVLPLIQETLVLLWEKLERHFLPLKAYELLVLPRSAYGGTETISRTGLQVAIARRADTALADLATEAKQTIARRIFLRLIQFGEGRADTRRQQTVDALQATADDPALFDQTLAHLVNCRLLTLSGDDKNSPSRVDIAHEALITGWPTLQHWTTERRGAEQIRRQLLVKAEEWERLGRASGGLLDSIELAEAENWISSMDAIEVGCDKILVNLIDKSKNAIRGVENNKRKRFLLIGSLASLALTTIGFAWQQQKQNKSTQAILDVQLNLVTPDNSKAILPILEYYISLADKANNAGEAEKTINYSRSVLDLTVKIESKIKENPGDFQNEEKQNFQRIAEKARSLLINAIRQYRLPKLEEYIKNKLIGEDIGTNSNSIALLENRFTEGALRETYKILMIDIGADANKSGLLIPQEEADRMPCEILMDIERVWREKTGKRCGWYGRGNELKEAECSELKKLSLTSSIFFPPDYSVPITRLNHCGFKK